MFTIGQSQLPSEVGRSEAAIAILKTKTLRLREVEASLLWTLFIRNYDQSLYLIEPEMYLIDFSQSMPKDSLGSNDINSIWTEDFNILYNNS